MVLFPRCEMAQQYAEESGRFACAKTTQKEECMVQLGSARSIAVVYIVKGKRTVRTEGWNCPARQGNVFMSSFSQRVELFEPEFSAEADEVLTLFVSRGFLGKMSSEESDLPALLGDLQPQTQLLMLGHQKRVWLGGLFERLGETQAQFGSDLLENAALVELMVGLLRLQSQHAQIHGQASSHRQEAPRADLAQALMLYIHQHLCETLSLGELSAKFYVSESYLCRVFKEAHGVTIGKYVQCCRLELAQKLLLQGNSVTDTCERSGFGDYTNFIKMFTHEKGVSPKKFYALSKKSIDTA